MKRFLPAFVMSLFIAVFFTACKNNPEEEPGVLNHDFTVEEWSEFIDEKNAAKENAGTASASETGNGDSEQEQAGDSAGDDASKSDSDKDLESGASKNADNTADQLKTVIVIDPGHGGRYTGAIYYKVNEKDITLKVSKYARDFLLENYENVEVYLTREEDVTLDGDLKVDLEMRAQVAKDHNANALVSIHFNASDEHNRTGAYIYVSRRPQVAEECRELAQAIMKELSELGIKERAIEQRKSNDMFDENGDAYDYYAINRHCAARNIPGIIVEQCFMDSDNDRQFIESEAALKALGEANARGIAAYYDLVKKEKE